MNVPVAEARALARQAALAGDAALAREIALALLREDPDDRAALVVLATASPQLGRAVEGRAAAARAWRLSTDGAGRYEAARLAAAAALAEERPLLAGLWLRLALVSAPTAEAEARTEAQARAVRQLSPWSVELSFGVAPSDNVNGGSNTGSYFIDGSPSPVVLSADARALSGWTASTDLTVTRRLAESERARTRLSFNLNGRAVALSEEARDLIAEDRLNPDLTGADFSSVGTSLRLRRDAVTEAGLAGAELELGQDWYGGDPYRRTLRAAGDLAVPLPGDQMLRLSGSAEQAWSLDGSADRLRLGVSGFWTQPAFGPDRLTLGLSGSATRSNNGNAASQSWGVRASYVLGRQVGPAELSATLAANWTQFPDYVVFTPVPGGREDRRLSVSLAAELTDWSLAGFQPVVSLEAARTESNVTRFDSDSLGLGLSFRSSF